MLFYIFIEWIDDKIIITILHINIADFRDDRETVIGKECLEFLGFTKNLSKQDYLYCKLEITVYRCSQLSSVFGNKMKIRINEFIECY